MDLTPEEIDEMQVAGALGDGSAQQMVRDMALANPALLVRLDELQRAVAALDQLLESPPPLALRRAVLASASTRAPSLEAPAPIGDLFARQVEALGVLLGELDAGDWSRQTEHYPWTVHGLVAHLLAIENYTAGQLELIDRVGGDDHHLSVGEDLIAQEVARLPQLTGSAWLERARQTAEAVQTDLSALPTEVMLHGWAFSREGAIIARAFEIWTHADDIRRATGRPTWEPTPADLRTMSSFSVRALPLTLLLTSPETEMTAARVVLTGDGGGTFDLGEADEAAVTIVLDVVDYCRVVARRVDPLDLEVAIVGDEPLARALLAGASAFAV